MGQRSGCTPGRAPPKTRVQLRLIRCGSAAPGGSAATALSLAPACCPPAARIRMLQTSRDAVETFGPGMLLKAPMRSAQPPALPLALSMTPAQRAQAEPTCKSCVHARARAELIKESTHPPCQGASRGSAGSAGSSARPAHRRAAPASQRGLRQHHTRVDPGCHDHGTELARAWLGRPSSRARRLPEQPAQVGSPSTNLSPVRLCGPHTASDCSFGQSFSRATAALPASPATSRKRTSSSRGPLRPAGNNCRSVGGRPKRLGVVHTWWCAAERVLMRAAPCSAARQVPH